MFPGMGGLAVTDFEEAAAGKMIESRRKPLRKRQSWKGW